MRRRDFLIVVGSTAIAWPMAVRAQQIGDVRRVAVLVAPTGSGLGGLDAFKTGMEKLGWIDGKKIHNTAVGSLDRLAEVAKEVVRQTPDVIVAAGTPTTVLLHRETKSLPIIFLFTSDPVGEGVVASLAHPGRNITGFSYLYPEIVGKWVQILKEIAPRTKRAALLFNPGTAPFVSSDVLRPQFESAARQTAIEPIMAPVHDTGEIKAAIKSLAQTQGGGLVVMVDPFLVLRRALIIETVAVCRQPIRLTLWLRKAGLSPTGRMYTTSTAVPRIT